MQNLIKIGQLVEHVTDKAQVAKLLEAAARFIEDARSETLSKETRPAEPAAQFQIDCFGYEIAAYPRELEFVFGDASLQQMWLLFDTGDIPEIRMVSDEIAGILGTAGE